MTTERLHTIADLIDRCELRTSLGTVLPFSNARDAHMMLEGRLSRPEGKIILDVKAGRERSPRPSKEPADAPHYVIAASRRFRWLF